MNLLDDIQVAATDSSKPVSDLLRKCQILAARLRSKLRDIDAGQRGDRFGARMEGKRKDFA